MEAGGRAAISVGTRPRWPRDDRSLPFKHHAARRYRIPRRDSTGLKLFGQGEWQEAKHGQARRSCRKLHLALDTDTGEIVASLLTGNDVDDAGRGAMRKFGVRG